MKSRTAGFILPLSIALMFAMLILALALMQQEQAHTNFTVLGLIEDQERSEAEVGFSTFQGILQGEATGAPTEFVDAATLITMGLNPGVGVPLSGGSQTGFNQPPDPSNPNGPAAAPITIEGTFNAGSAGDIPGSLLRPNSGDGFADAFTVGLPNRAAMVVEQVGQSNPSNPRAEVGTATSYCSVYSPNFPFGLLAISGKISVGSVLSTQDLVVQAGVSNGSFALGQHGEEIGLPVDVYAESDITVSSYLNGNAFSHSGTITLPTGGSTGVRGGTALTSASVQTLPSDFITGLGQAGFGAIGSGTSNPIASAESEVVGGNNGPCDGGPGLINSALSLSPLVVPGSFQAVQSVTVPTMQVGTDLVVPNGKVLVVDGDLTVAGHIYMGQNATLAVTGAIKAEDVDMFQLPPSTPNGNGLNSTIMAGQDLVLTKGMNATVPPGIDLAGGFFSAKNFGHEVPNPVPPGGDTFVPCTTEDQASANTAAAENAALVGTGGSGPQFFVTVSEPTQTEPLPSDPPGVLIVSIQGNITMGAPDGLPAGRPAICGLLVAETGSVTLTDVPLMAGVMWAGSSINASTTDFRFFPYYTHAKIRLANGTDSTVQALRYYRTAAVRVP